MILINTSSGIKSFFIAICSDGKERHKRIPSKIGRPLVYGCPYKRFFREIIPLIIFKISYFRYLLNGKYVFISKTVIYSYITIRIKIVKCYAARYGNICHTKVSIAFYNNIHNAFMICDPVHRIVS